MAFSVNEFTSKHFSSDLYRANLFEVTMLSSNVVAIDQDIRFMVKGASIPASNVASVEVPFQNRVVKIAGDRTFDDWTVTVLNDQEFKYRDVLEVWMDTIQTHGAINGADPEDYKAVLKVQPKTRQGENAGAAYEFSGAFPTAIDAIDLAWGTDGAPAEYGVTFSYDYWTKGSVTS